MIEPQGTPSFSDCVEENESAKNREEEPSQRSD